MLVLLHDVIWVAAVPLNATLPLPWLVPKLLPEITTDDPTAPLWGIKPVILGVAVVLTVKLTPLLVPPFTVTNIFPLVAPEGTRATIW
jgi:hypothetical protein